MAEGKKGKKAGNHKIHCTAYRTKQTTERNHARKTFKQVFRSKGTDVEAFGHFKRYQQYATPNQVHRINELKKKLGITT